MYHRLSATGGGTLASYYCGRNFVLVWAKNMPSALARRFWPALLRAQIGYALESFWHFREAAARARLRGQFDSLRALPRFLRKRAHRFSKSAAPRLAAALDHENQYPATESTEYTEI